MYLEDISKIIYKKENTSKKIKIISYQNNLVIWNGNDIDLEHWNNIKYWEIVEIIRNPENEYSEFGIKIPLHNKSWIIYVKQIY